MKNVKMIKSPGLLLIFFSSLFSGCFDESIPKFVDQDAVSADGVNFTTKKLIVIDSATGQKVQPCIPADGANLSLKKKKKLDASNLIKGVEKCKTELILDKDNLPLMAALELSKKPINVKIKVNGKNRDATLVTIHKVLYTGSRCNTDYSGGNQYENCGRRRRP